MTGKICIEHIHLLLILSDGVVVGAYHAPDGKFVLLGSNRFTDTPSGILVSLSDTDGVASSLCRLSGAKVEAWGDRWVNIPSPGCIGELTY